MQSGTGEGVSAIRTIQDRIREVSEISSAIAAAVEQQGSATREIAQNVQRAADGTGEVTQTIGIVVRITAETGQAAGEVLKAAGELSLHSERLSGGVGTSLDDVKAA